MDVSMVSLRMLACAVAVVVVSPARAEARELPNLGADFLWGVSSSGYQSEGYAPDSNWSRYAASGATADPYLNSVDFLHRASGDIALADSLGVDVYRTSVEWSRVQPQPGVWSEGGFAFYDSVFAHIAAAGMRPMITLDHWVYPGWEVDRGGWRNPQMVMDWLANMRRVVDRYAHYDPLWVTINEPVAYVGQEIRTGGVGPADVPSMFDRLVQAHNGIYDYIHAVQPGALVTSNVAYIPGGAEPVLDTQFEDRVKLDFVGIDFYYAASTTRPPTLDPLFGRHWDAELEADGIYYALRHYSRKFPGKPLYIVENGMPTEHGQPRRDGYTRGDHLSDIVYWLQRARADGMNLLGYNYWSLTDNYEWGSYAPRFGLYSVDVRTDPTLTRRPTDAVPVYRGIVAGDGVAPGYVPTRPAAPCSLMDPPSSCAEPVR
ncbi:family 1 glycosylhydrolase [Antrihabitans sp. YC2-6]|uniref:family 1 glycosylhydrolase n=1 Tax=Antrihabitans sp. YC2-6 TaxID=2799498 RepID=UPI0018F4023E|nr:family 1 glycosylhydrolase [Antrihabitans sp. YC2-6]MBJ8344973.1 glycoside hydrolase family 1 protein [Antrihabitans sp. YC2-6]